MPEVAEAQPTVEAEKVLAEQAVVETVDFFTPVVDDPYWFGRIAGRVYLSLDVTLDLLGPLGLRTLQDLVHMFGGTIWFTNSPLGNEALRILQNRPPRPLRLRRPPS